MVKRFLRQDHDRFSRLGKGRKKLLKWRRPKGRHSKMRQRWANYPVSPSPGYKSPRILANKIKGKIPALIHNISELANLSKNNVVIIAKVGAKKRISIIKKAQEINIEICNVSKQGVKNEA